MYCRIAMSSLMGCLLLLGTPCLAGPPEEAAKAFAEGKALLKKADFDAALQVFRTAARLDSDNHEYRQHYAMLRQVIRMRQQIDKEQNSDQWMQMSRALRSFYYAHQIFSAALRLDEKIHKRIASSDSAAILAETQLALGMDAAAAETLTSLKDVEATPRTNVLLGIALARQGRINEAKVLARKTAVTNDAGPRSLYEFACLQALIGDAKGASEALSRSFELTSPSRLAAVKADAKACKDLRTLAGTAGFAGALATQSKIKESECSAGTGCGRCPMRSSCTAGSANRDKRPCKQAETKP